jgi:hypothetical protein
VLWSKQASKISYKSSILFAFCLLAVGCKKHSDQSDSGSLPLAKETKCFFLELHGSSCIQSVHQFTFNIPVFTEGEADKLKLVNETLRSYSWSFHQTAVPYNARFSCSEAITQSPLPPCTNLLSIKTVGEHKAVEAGPNHYQIEFNYTRSEEYASSVTDNTPSLFKKKKVLDVDLSTAIIIEKLEPDSALKPDRYDYGEY